MREENHTGGEHDEARLSEAAIGQLYRGELGRSDRWRMRLDTTTNWALTTTAAVVSYSFSNTRTSHVTLLVGIWMVITFLGIEARRYRYYDLFYRRVRLLEHGFWSPLLRREPEDPDAMRELATELERPALRLSLPSALATRMNRTYGPILLVLLATWILKVEAHPTPATSFAEFVRRAHVGFVPGAVVLGVLAVGALGGLSLLVVFLVGRTPMGELRPIPRSRRRALWETFARPYELAPPRLRRRKKKPPAAETRRPDGARSAPS